MVGQQVKPYFQPYFQPLLEARTLTNLQHAAIKIATHAESDSQISDFLIN